jgi:hypothetical protein
MLPSSLPLNGIYWDLLIDQARRGYVIMQSMKRAGRYQSHESLLIIPGMINLLNSQ